MPLDVELVRHAGDAGRPSVLMYAVYPYHITTDPWEFSPFWSIDVRRIKAYVLELQAVCTRRSSLTDGVREGASARLQVDVQR